MTFTLGGTFQTALFRAFVGAVIVGAATAVGVYASTDELKPVVVAFLVAFFGVGGFRGFGEGLIDASRQKAGDVAPADVQAVGSGKA